MATSTAHPRIVEIANGKALMPTSDPDFFMTPWEDRSNGAKVAIVYTFKLETGPIATPVVWMQHFEDTQEKQIDRAIDRIKSNNAYGN